MSTLTSLFGLIFMSSILCFFGNSWILIWSLMELNTMAFSALPCTTTKEESKDSKSGMMIYFMIQTIASAILIISVTLKTESLLLQSFTSYLAVLVLMIKIAAVPFYSWFMKVPKMLGWAQIFMLFTWQKLIPIFIFSFQKKSILWVPIILSSLAESLFIMNKKSIKEILGYSSIFNLSWILSSIVIKTSQMLTFILLYWYSLLFFIKQVSSFVSASFNETSAQKKSQNYKLHRRNCLGGNPPFSMFLAKWMVLSSLLLVGIKSLPVFLLILSSINLFMYLRISTYTNLVATVKTLKSKPQAQKTFYFQVVTTLAIPMIMLTVQQ